MISFLTRTSIRVNGWMFRLAHFQLQIFKAGHVVQFREQQINFVFRARDKKIDAFCA